MPETTASSRSTATMRSDEAIKQEYAGQAAHYDRRWAKYIRRTTDNTVRRLSVRAGGWLLDVACGTGALLSAVADTHEHLFGVDLSFPMLSVAREKLAPWVKLLVGRAEALPLDEKRFDVVVTANSFHYFADPRAALREIGRVLRPGGELVLTDWCDDYLACRLCDRLLRLWGSPYHRIYGSSECRGLLETAGYEVLSLERYKISWLWGLMTAVARWTG